MAAICNFLISVHFDEHLAYSQPYSLEWKIENVSSMLVTIEDIINLQYMQLNNIVVMAMSYDKPHVINVRGG